MNYFRTSSQLKAEARQLMMGKYKTAIAMFMILETIVMTITFCSSMFLDSSSSAGLILTLAISFLISVFSSLLMVGFISFFLKVACRQPYAIGDIFLGFKFHPNKIISLQFILLGISYLYALPAVLPAVIALIAYASTNNGLFFLLFAILLILGIVVVVWIMLSYSQIFYLLLDFPESSTREILRRSKSLMKGHKWRLFYIQMSFIPLSLLSLLTFGIGALFLTPYQQMTYTLFYLDLIQSQTKPSFEAVADDVLVV